MLAKKRLIACLLAALTLPAVAQMAEGQAVAPVAPDTPLVVDGSVSVIAADFEGNILRIPLDRRGGFRMSYDRVISVVDNVYVTRSIAQKARDAGLDTDPAIQARMRQLQDAFLADLYAQKLEKDAGNIDFEQRARELYIADREKYKTDEEAHVHQILIGNTCRTTQQAREVARGAWEEAKAGKEDFPGSR